MNTPKNEAAPATTQTCLISIPSLNAATTAFYRSLDPRLQRLVNNREIEIIITPDSEFTIERLIQTLQHYDRAVKLSYRLRQDRPEKKAIIAALRTDAVAIEADVMPGKLAELYAAFKEHKDRRTLPGIVIENLSRITCKVNLKALLQGMALGRKEAYLQSQEDPYPSVHQYLIEAKSFDDTVGCSDDEMTAPLERYLPEETIEITDGPVKLLILKEVLLRLPEKIKPAGEQQEETRKGRKNPLTRIIESLQFLSLLRPEPSSPITLKKERT